MPLRRIRPRARARSRSPRPYGDSWRDRLALLARPGHVTDVARTMARATLPIRNVPPHTSGPTGDVPIEGAA